MRVVRSFNLDRAGQEKRLRFSIYALAIALFASVLVVQSDLDRLWRAALFLPFLVSAVTALEALYKT